MKIYVAHSTKKNLNTPYNYQENLYAPLKQSKLWDAHNFILPHDKSTIATSSQNIIKTADMILAEVSFPSTGLGIELGWAHIYGKNVLCIHKKDYSLTSALKCICANNINFLEYSGIKNLIEQLHMWFEKVY